MDFFACLVSCLFIMASFTTAQADFCGYRYGKSWYCYGSHQYCCGFSSLTGLCCTQPFYTWWYFWIGILMFLFFVTAVIAFWRRQRMRRQLQASTTARIQSGVIVQGQGQQQPAGFVNSIAPPTAAAPPMYPAVAPAYQNTLVPSTANAPPAYPAVVPAYQNTPYQPPLAYNSQNYYPEAGKDVKKNLNNVQ